MYPQATGHRSARRGRLAVLAVVAATVLAACGSSSSSSSGTRSTSAGGSTATTAASSPTSASGVASGSSSSVAGAASGPGTPAPKPLPTKTSVTIGISAPIEVFTEPEIALVNGEFAKENLNASVKLVPATGWPQLLAQGSIQLAVAGISAGGLNAVNSGVDLKFIAAPWHLAPTDPSGLWVAKKFLNPDGSLKKPVPSDFSVSLGNQGLGPVSIYWTEQYLEKNGTTMKNVRNVSLNQADILTALENGGIDAGYVNDPFAGALLSNPNFERVAPSGGAGGILTTSSFISQHPQVLQAVMRALLRTARTYMGPGYRNNTMVINQMSKWLGVPVSTIDKSPPLDFTPDMNLSAFDQILLGAQTTWLKLGVLNYHKPLTLNQLVDPSVLAQVTGSS